MITMRYLRVEIYVWVNVGPSLKKNTIATVIIILRAGRRGPRTYMHQAGIHT